MNRRYILSGATVILVIVLLSVVTAAPPSRMEARPGDFDLTLSADKAEYAVGETPKFFAQLINKSGGEALLVPALHGSEMPMRAPVVKFEITRPNDAPKVPTTVVCGNTNNIQVSDFVTVPAGESLDPAPSLVTPAKQLFNAPGAYVISLTYDTSGKNEAWYGYMGELKRKWVINRLLARVPIVKLKSNEITIAFSGAPLEVSDRTLK